MNTLPGWTEHVVPQKRPGSGCVPWGYEIMLRYHGISGIEFTTFQDEFDLDKNPRPGETAQNDFGAVARAISGKYPHVVIKVKVFRPGEGEEKLRFVEGLIEKHRLVLISLALEPWGKKHRWHVMPVVDTTDDSLKLLHHVDVDGKPATGDIAKSLFALIHNRCKGGDDIAFLDM